MAVSGESPLSTSQTPKYSSPALPEPWGRRWVGGWDSRGLPVPTSVRPAELLFRSPKPGLRRRRPRGTGARGSVGETRAAGRRGRRGGPARRGGIPGEAASRSQRGGGQKKSAGEGKSSLALDAAGAGKTEPEPEPVRAPAIVARPPPPAASSARRARSREGPRTRRAGPRAPSGCRRRAAAAAGLRGRCFEAGPDGNLPPLAGTAAYRRVGEEPPPPPVPTAEESGPPRDGEQPAALRDKVPVTSGCGTPSPGARGRPSARSLVGAARKTRGVPRPGDMEPREPGAGRPETRPKLRPRAAGSPR